MIIRLKIWWKWYVFQPCFIIQGTHDCKYQFINKNFVILSDLDLFQSNPTFQLLWGLVLGKISSLTLLDCWRRCLSKYLGFTWMLWGGRCDWDSLLSVVDAEAEPLTAGVKPSSFSIIWRVWGGKTPLQVPKRCLILEWTAGSTCLYALQNT